MHESHVHGASLVGGSCKLKTKQLETQRKPSRRFCEDDYGDHGLMFVSTLNSYMEA